MAERSSAPVALGAPLGAPLDAPLDAPLGGAPAAPLTMSDARDDWHGGASSMVQGGEAGGWWDKLSIPSVVGRIEARRPYGSLYPGGKSAAFLAVICGLVVVIAIASLVTSPSSSDATHWRTSAGDLGGTSSTLDYVRMPDPQRQHGRNNPWRSSSRFVVELKHQAMDEV